MQVDLDREGRALVTLLGRPLRSRVSPESPEIPSSPDSVSRARSTDSGSICPWLWTQSSRPGSTEPGRVAMTRPSRGVKPIVVSTERPPATAASDAPAPRWAVTRRSSESGRPSSPRRAGRRRRARGRESRSGAAPSARPTPPGAHRSKPPREGCGERRCRSRRRPAARGAVAARPGSPGSRAGCGEGPAPRVASGWTPARRR